MIIRLMGGLGNQMFQYALYKKLLSLGRHAVLDDHELIRHGNQHNGLELPEAFGISYQRMNCQETMRYYYWVIRYFMKRKLGFPFHDRFFLEDHFQRSVSDMISSGREYLYGYWQKEEYFRDIREELMSDFTFNLQNMNEKTAKTALKIKECESVSIHVRRGDFLLEDNRQGICTLDYYKGAVRYMKQSVPDACFFVFSDDSGWAEEHFGDIVHTLVSWNKGRSSYQDLYLMSLCKHNIIANSTFSWWGAWLGRNEEKIVICPHKWLSDRDFNPVLDSWIRAGEDGQIVKAGNRGKGDI